MSDEDEAWSRGPAIDDTAKPAPPDPSMPLPAIRIATTPADLDTIHQVLARVWAPPPALPPAGLQMAGVAGIVCLLARVDGTPAGALRLVDAGDVMHLEKLTILPAFRGGRLRRRLFAAGVAVAGVRGADAVTACVYPRHLPAWRRHGATVTGGPVWIEGQPAVPLRLELRK